MSLKISNNLTTNDLESFKTLFEESISPLYPNSTLKTAESIIQKHLLGTDPNGYFTKRKTIWKGILENNELVAFTVISEKRGGSIKFGPTMVSKSCRGKGIGSSFRRLVEEEYSSKEYRKAYSTTNLYNLPAILYILKIGYKIELHLKSHYSKIDDELVLSKNIDKQKNTTFKYSAQVKNVPDFIVDYMQKYYEEIDEVFFQNIEKTITEKFDFTEDFFIAKRKHKFQIDNEKQYAIVTPKRGGCAKISPLILSTNSLKNSEFIQLIIKHYDESSIHKFYTFIPLDRLDEIEVLKNNGFFIEGIITEPYKNGVDLIMLSFIKIN